MAGGELVGEMIESFVLVAECFRTKRTRDVSVLDNGGKVAVLIGRMNVDHGGNLDQRGIVVNHRNHAQVGNDARTAARSLTIPDQLKILAVVEAVCLAAVV